MAKRKTRSSAVAATATSKPVAAQNPGLLVQARYDAAGAGRRMTGWNPPSTGPNKAIAGLGVIRNRSRDAGRNEWAGASSARIITTNLIGTGIVARPRTKDAALKTKLVAEWDKFVDAADADGALDFYGLQALAVRSWFQAGECFARIRARRLYDGLPVPMQVQLLEADMLPLLDADQWPGLKPGNVIRQGIEIDRVGRRAAYWMYRSHPGDFAAQASLTDLVRIPADEILHVYKPERPGQLRGVPDAAPILAKMRAVMDFDDATLERQRIANLFAMFLKKPMPTSAEAGIDPLTGKTISYDANGAPIAALEPGISQELLPGEDVVFSDPPDAGATYGDFIRQQNLGIAAGQGIPHELMSGDIRDVSDRTLRVVINEFRRHCEQLQWTIIIPKLCRPVRAAWARAAVLAGVLSEAEAAEALLTDWQPQGWAYIHPVQDVQSKQAEVEAGFRSRSSVILERGDDPEAVDQARADDAAREQALDLAKPDPDPAAQQQQQEQQAKQEAAQQNRIQNDLRSLRAEVQAFMHRPPTPAPTPTVVNVAGTTVHTPATEVKNEIAIPAPVVNVTTPEVRNEINVDAPTVNMPAPIISVTTPEVRNEIKVENNQPPAEVTVNLPTRKTETTIVRDAKGDMVRATQIERDVEDGN